jgi:hypothetical protein
MFLRRRKINAHTTKPTIDPIAAIDYLEASHC